MNVILIGRFLSTYFKKVSEFVMDNRLLSMPACFADTSIQGSTGAAIIWLARIHCDLPYEILDTIMLGYETATNTAWQIWRAFEMNISRRCLCMTPSIFLSSRSLWLVSVMEFEWSLPDRMRKPILPFIYHLFSGI